MGAPLHTGDPLLDRQAVIGHWLLRAPLALVFFYNGGLRLINGQSLLLALVEVAIGIAVIVGALIGSWLTRLGALVACLILLGGVFTTHWGQWHPLPSATHPSGGMALQITLLCLGIYLLIRGNEV